MEARPGEQRVTFGDYAFDLGSAILFKSGNWIRVPDQSLKVLAALLEKPGEIVTREELSRRLWPNGTHVEFEQGLNSVIKRLRIVLLDSSAAPQYIETLPKRGYRFIYPVQQAPPASANGELSTRKPLHRRVILLALLFISAGAAIVYQRFSRPAQDLPVLSQSIRIVSDPSGATVFWHPYADLKSPWRLLGKTPLENVCLSAGAVRLRLSKPGYTDLEIAASEFRSQLHMQPTGTQPGMVHIPAGPLFAQYSGLGRLGPITLNDFWIDRTEVTNSEYQKFVNARGYKDPRYWKFPFVENARALTWKEAVAKFTDQTGNGSPAGWSAGSYPTGQRDFPVSGVSWYEAAAYANFAGKALPTVYQWFRAAHTDDSVFLIPFSNFNGHGPVPVQSRGGLGSFGVFDMAGNAREWCLNESAGMRFILGGAWSDPTYMFTRGQKLPGLDRSPLNGFRCIKSAESIAPQPQLAAPIPPSDSGSLASIPASDEVYKTSRSLYASDRADLHPKLESVTETEMWRREKVRFGNGYPNQETGAYLFLPRQGRPPYPCVIFVPSSDVFQARSGDTIQPEDYLLSSGRAIIYPIFWGTFDRFVSLPSDPANAGYPSPMFIREALIAWKKDLGRTLAYLATRKDIGPIGYLGVSTGAEFAPVLLAGEERVKAAVLLSGAMPVQMKLMPESNPVNFAPRMKTPVLMLNGRYDSILTPDAQESMFRSLGTVAPNKSHVLVNSGHSVLAPEVRNQTIHQTLHWFDRYLSSRTTSEPQP
ncbi:MAG: SUMF1/EgtB/PvdO family nonheme iron enzyme [Acidobacteriota bacterium]|nr:SUMF1/EgtB/PvdO family nonheme iron enzyme [Acidobacteriota bacterium]